MRVVGYFIILEIALYSTYARNHGRQIHCYIFEESDGQHHFVHKYVLLTGYKAYVRVLN